MRHIDRRGRRATTASLGAGLAGALVAATLGGGSAGASGADGPLRDGNWSGTLAVGATIDFSQSGVGVVTSGEGNGSFDLLVAGGIAGGTWALGASSTASVEATGS